MWRVSLAFYANAPAASYPLKFTLTALPAAAADENGDGYVRRISHVPRIGTTDNALSCF